MEAPANGDQQDLGYRIQHACSGQSENINQEAEVGQERVAFEPIFTGRSRICRRKYSL